MRILVACESSGTVREAFRAKGHEAWSCDLLPADDGSLFHLQGDARDLLRDGWDMLIAHPPCTRLTVSGVRWLHERYLWDDLKEACELFNAFLHAPIPLRCIENPIPHRYALERIGRRYDQIIQPWQYGHGETKATCLWLNGLPKLVPTNIVEGRKGYCHSLPPSPDRWKLRSKTYQGIADAMADQWSSVYKHV
jgi:hypothetical protein